jgi:hypothetical protein
MKSSDGEKLRKYCCCPYAFFLLGFSLTFYYFVLLTFFIFLLFRVNLLAIINRLKVPWIPEPSTVNNKLKRREGSGSTGRFFD